MEEKIRHNSRLKQKINLLSLTDSNQQPKKARIRVKKLLTKISEFCQPQTSKFLSEKCVNQQKQLKKEDSKFWIKKYPPETSSKSFRSKIEKIQKQDQPINWTRILWKNQKMDLNKLKKRIEVFKSSQYFYKEKTKQLENQENSLISNVLQNFSIRL